MSVVEDWKENNDYLAEKRRKQSLGYILKDLVHSMREPARYFVLAWITIAIHGYIDDLPFFEDRPATTSWLASAGIVGLTVFVLNAVLNVPGRIKEAVEDHHGSRMLEEVAVDKPQSTSNGRH